MEWWFGSRRKKMPPICFFLMLQIGVVAVHAQSPSTQDEIPFFINVDRSCNQRFLVLKQASSVLTAAALQITPTPPPEFPTSPIAISLIPGRVNFQISSDCVSSSLDLQLLTLRSFPNSSRSCYVLSHVRQ